MLDIAGRASSTTASCLPLSLHLVRHVVGVLQFRIVSSLSNDPCEGATYRTAETSRIATRRCHSSTVWRPQQSRNLASRPFASPADRSTASSTERAHRTSPLLSVSAPLLGEMARKSIVPWAPRDPARFGYLFLGLWFCLVARAIVADASVRRPLGLKVRLSLPPARPMADLLVAAIDARAGSGGLL